VFNTEEEDPDDEVLDTILKDIKRTRPDMNFFLTPTTLSHNDIVIGNIPKRNYNLPFITGFNDMIDS